MLLTMSAVAKPQLDSCNPTGFFTNVAMALFQQMDLHDFNGNLVTVTNIPIYEDPALFGGTNINYYTPAVQRILQLAANIFDATTNRFIGDGPTNYPTVFRPIFNSHNGIATIIGYAEVSNPAEAFLPTLNASDFIKVDQPANSSVNMYGVPWVIGAKKGFPNFNEFSMENALTVWRKLTFTNFTTNPPWFTNQTFGLDITNSFGVEAWNSYTNFYARPLRLVVSNELSITITNETGETLLDVKNLPFGSDILFTSWPGWTERLTDTSFQVPLYAYNVFTNGIYERFPPYLIPLSVPVWSVTFVPRLWMVLQFKLRYVLIDTSVNRVVDFVNISSTQPAVDISYMLNHNNPSTNHWVPDYTNDGEWNTNQVIGTTLQMGILNQIEVSKANHASVWTDPVQRATQGPRFNHYLLNGGTNYFQAPYTPQRTILQRISFQANDPLVHYTESDLMSTNAIMANYNMVAIGPVSEPPLVNLTNLNFAYQPWGGYHLPGGNALWNSQYDFDLRVKDPGVQQSDDWNFPTGESLAFEWLGRVHRGTPWQTVFLKPSNQTAGQWSTWNNDNVVVTNGNLLFFDAVFTYPNNDWHIASLWDQWVNTNDLASRLSINNTDTNAWEARLDGLTALTNSGFGELDPITISSNSPQAGAIAQAIQSARANATIFKDVGDVLAAAQLSIGSPFLNTNGMNFRASANGITDEALEKIPTQLLPLLRADSFGKIIPADGQLEMSFSGYDGHTYAIEASTNFIDWVVISTNCASDGNFGITNSTTSDRQFYRSVLVR